MPFPIKQKEDALQEQCVWLMHVLWPKYELLLHHSPNGGSRNPIEGAKFKRMGVRAGFPDLFFAFPSNGYHGLFLELKTETGRLQKSQVEMLQRLKEQGYKCEVIRSVEDFQREIKQYINEGG